MSKLKAIREQLNLTQEELAEKSGVSVRTIQRIEAGTEPKGYTRRVLAAALQIPEESLLEKAVQPASGPATQNHAEEIPKVENVRTVHFSRIKIINLSSLPFVVFPPLNIILPVVLMFAFKLKQPIVKQIISVQLLWSILAPIIFMLGIFMRLGNRFTLVWMILLALSNIFIILRNAAEIDKNKQLYFKLNFNLI